MKKIYIIIALLLFGTTGCTVNYNIILNSDSIDEFVQFSESANLIDTNILENGTLTYQGAIDNLYMIPQPVYIDANVNLYDETQVIEGVSYYSKELINDEFYGIKGKFSHTLTDYKKSKIINKCYDNISVLESNNTFVLSTSRKFSCFSKYTNLDIVNVQITIDNEEYTVKSHNADNVVDNVYNWNITRENSNNKSVVIEFIRNSNAQQNETKGNDTSTTVLLFIILIIVGIGCSIFMIINYIRKKTNTI